MSRLPDDHPRQFSWPMRLFLGYSIFYMVSSSVIDIFKHASWQDDFEIVTRPLRLPTDQEITAVEQGTHPDGYASVADRYKASFSSLSTYFIPGLHPVFIDNDASEDQLNDPLDYVQLSLIWYQSRALFLGRLVGVDQNWPMFAPDVETSASYPRFEMRYDDGSSLIHRSVCDPPEDLLQPFYPHWFYQKRRAMCTSVLDDEDVRKGYLHHLQRRYSKHASNLSITEIHIHRVSYNYPPPNVDVKAWYAHQSGPPPQQVSPFEFSFQNVDGEMQAFPGHGND